MVLGDEDDDECEGGLGIQQENNGAETQEEE